MDPVVSTDWLARRLDEVVVLDASMAPVGVPPSTDTDPDLAFRRVRIPGARRFDIEAVSDPDSDLPHMAPTPSAFARDMGLLGIGAEATVIVYDTAGLFSAARAWWTFRLMGHAAVAVLDGGLPKWLAEGRASESGEPGAPTPAAPMPATLDPTLVADADAVARALATGFAQVLDARSRPRFEGRVPEPRPGLRSGHMPGARNLPFAEVLNADGTLKDEDALRAALAAEGIDPASLVITTCGSGVTAAVLSLALARLGRRSAIYDGSWAEWGALPESGPIRPVVTGP